MALALETDGLVRLASRDLDRLWREIGEGGDPRAALNDILPALVTQYGSMGAAVAADWYDDQRDRVGARGRFTAIPVEPADRGAHALIGWALNEAQDDSGLRKLILGGTQRRIADHVRETVAQSSARDPGARGWERVGREECDWCEQYIGIVTTVPGYDFPAHDFCNCGVEPVWIGDSSITARSD